MGKTNRVEQQVIRRTHPKYKIIDEMCFHAKNLYNAANYILRQEFIANGHYIPYREMNRDLKHTLEYKNTMSQPANCVLRLLDKNWKSFFIGVKDYEKNPRKYLGKPKLPGYLKKDGRFLWMIPNNSCSLNGDGTIRFGVKRLQGYVWKTHAKGRLIQVRFVPRGTCYVMEVVYEVEVPDSVSMEPECIASIDFGVDNLVTMTNNIGEKPIVINGKGVKSINQYYNKRLAKIQSELRKVNQRGWSHQLEALALKRYQRIKNYMHHASRYVINWCVVHNIDTLVVGINHGWKQSSAMSRDSNQKFVLIPHDMLLQQLRYKCQDAGIQLIEVDEAYTSGTSFLDGEYPCQENYDKKRRIARGLFRTATGKLINADVNGSLQIMIKAFPNAFNERYGIEAYLTPIAVNVTNVACGAMNVLSTIE